MNKYEGLGFNVYLVGGGRFAAIKARNVSIERVEEIRRELEGNKKYSIAYCLVGSTRDRELTEYTKEY